MAESDEAKTFVEKGEVVALPKDATAAAIPAIAALALSLGIRDHSS